MKKIIAIILILIVCGCVVNQQRAVEFWDKNVQNFPEETP